MLWLRGYDLVSEHTVSASRPHRFHLLCSQVRSVGECEQRLRDLLACDRRLAAVGGDQVDRTEARAELRDAGHYSQRAYPFPTDFL